MVECTICSIIAAALAVFLLVGEFFLIAILTTVAVIEMTTYNTYGPLANSMDTGPADNSILVLH